MIDGVGGVGESLKQHSKLYLSTLILLKTTRPRALERKNINPVRYFTGVISI